LHQQQQINDRIYGYVKPAIHKGIDLDRFPCECEHNNPDSLDARLFPFVVLSVAPAVTMDEASSLSTSPAA